MLAEALAFAAHCGYDAPHFFQMADLASATGGVVYFGPDACLIAFDEAADDTWFLWCFVGSLPRALALAPHPRRFVAWAREAKGRKVRVRYAWDRVARLAQGSACVLQALPSLNAATHHGIETQSRRARANCRPDRAPGRDVG